MVCSTGSFKAGENRDGCADRRRESPSTHLIERRIELKVRIGIIITIQISHYSYRSDRLHSFYYYLSFQTPVALCFHVEVRELATIYSTQQEIDTRVVLYIHRTAALVWIQERRNQNH